MALESPRLAGEYPTSISSRESFSSDDTGTGRPRHNTLPSSPVPSSLSIEVPARRDDETTSPGHPSRFLGAGRFFRPGSEDQSGWTRIRERASWSKSFPRPFDNKSMWPSASQRDLLKEAGDWLDTHFPVPDPPTPESEWQPPPSPFPEDFRTSSLLGSSRPTSSSTTGEEFDGADGKIVYNERENKLRDLLDKMRRDYDSGKTAKPSREARVRRYLKEIQTQNETEATITSRPVELDASVSLQRTERELEEPEPETSTADDQFPYESAKESLLLCESLENEPFFQPLPAIDLSLPFEADFSAANARALNDLPSPSKSEVDIGSEAAKTPTPTTLSKPQPDYFGADRSCNVSPPIQPVKPYKESSRISNSSFLNRDSTASANSSQAISDQVSLSTRGSGDLVNEPRQVSIDKVPQLDRSPTRSVFSDLDNLVRASRTRHSDVRKTH